MGTGRPQGARQGVLAGGGGRGKSASGEGGVHARGTNELGTGRSKGAHTKDEGDGRMKAG